MRFAQAKKAEKHPGVFLRKKGQVSDEEIWAVLAYIKSTWPEKIRAWQTEVMRNAARR